VAKSSVILDVKPWDDETNMADTEKQVRSIAMDGLLWGACKLIYHMFQKTIISIKSYFCLNKTLLLNLYCFFNLVIRNVFQKLIKSHMHFKLSWFLSVSVSKSCRSCAWLKTKRCRSRNCRKRSRLSRTL